MRLRWAVLTGALVAASYLVVSGAASYPSAVKSFTTKATNDTIQASHVNDLQDEVAAVEDALLNGFVHHLKSTAGGTNTYDLGVSGAVWRDLNLGRNASIGGTLGVTGVATFTAVPVFSAGLGALSTSGLTLTGTGATTLTFSGSAAATGLIATNHTLLLQSNTDISLQIDANNNSTSVFQLFNGAGGTMVSLDEPGNIAIGGAVASLGGSATATPDVTGVYKDSIVKAWASIANAGSPTITDDYNVASLSDDGTGLVTLTFATAIASANYACSVTAEGATVDRSASVVAKTTTTVQVSTITANNGAATDTNFNVICVGE